MVDLTPEIASTIVPAAVGIIFSIFFITNILTLFSLRSASKERQALNKELFGLMKKIEGLTSSRREQMLRHYDSLLEVLSTKLPTAVAAQTSQIIFDTEAKILTRLAEIEPNLNNDEKGKEKLNELIRSMEGLERTLVNLTSDAVRDVMVEGRRSLFAGDSELDSNFSAN